MKQADEDAHAAAVRADTGLLARLDALGTLTGDRPTLRTAYLVLMLFITTIEVLPVLVTFLTNVSEPTLYQRVRGAVESNELAAAESDLERERQLSVRLAATEHEVYLHRLDAWRREQTGLVAAGPDPGGGQATRRRLAGSPARRSVPRRPAGAATPGSYNDR